jgi:Raf kinase inhibitor-like YbhB/YbcL family protein
MTIRLTSPAFAEGGMIPKPYTCDGADKSPPLEWSGVPASARSLALICDDPDAPAGTWSHWVLFDLPPSTKSLEEGIAADLQAKLVSKPAGQEPQVSVRQGKNDFGKIGYGGPCPPGGTHRYFFRLYALDAPLDLEPGATRSSVLKAITGHVVAEGRLMGKYSRSS